MLWETVCPVCGVAMGSYYSVRANAVTVDWDDSNFEPWFIYAVVRRELDETRSFDAVGLSIIYSRPVTWRAKH